MRDTILGFGLLLGGMAATLGVSGCKQPTQTRFLPDTALPQQDTGPDDLCDAEVFETAPFDGQQGIYYLDPISVSFTEEAVGSVVRLEKDGQLAPGELTWDETGLNATLTPLNPLEPVADYVLSVQTCPENPVTEVSFTTSSFGAEMTVEPSELAGRTYYLDLGGAFYEEPAGLGGLIAQYLNQPLLIGVVSSNVDAIELMGAQGRVDGATGAILQDNRLSTFYFGSASFVSRPYLLASAPAVPLTYDGTDITFYNFRLEATFSADGEVLGEPRLTGQIDTRNLGPLLGVGSAPDATCETASGLGVDCEACPDGEELCLPLRGSFPNGAYLPGVTLSPR